MNPPCPGSPICQRRQRNFPDFSNKSKFFNVAEQARTLVLYGLVCQKSTSRTKSKSFEPLGHSNFRCGMKISPDIRVHTCQVAPTPSILPKNLSLALLVLLVA